MRFLLLLIVSLIQSGVSIGQSFTSFNLSMEEGLPSSEVYQIYQDKEGFIWFATDNGIVKYDGKEIQTFHINDGLSDPVIFGFQEDDEGRVWFKSYTGKLSYYENGKIKKYKFNNLITDIATHGIPTFTYSSEKKELTILSKKTLAKIDSMGIIKTEKLKEDGVYYFGSIDNGVMGLTTVNLDYYNIFINGEKYPAPVSQKPYHLSTYGVPSRSILWRGKLYISIKNNVFCYDNNTVTNVYAGRAPIISFSKDRDDNLWIGYMNNGSERFSNTEFLNPTDLPILKDLSITSLLMDQDRGLWISTLETGVYYIPNKEIENYIPSEKSKVMQISTLGDSLFKSNQKGELTIIDSQSKKIIWETSLNSPAHDFYITKKKKVFLFADVTYVYDSLMRFEKKILFAGMDFIEEKNGILWVYGNATVGKFDEDGMLLFKKRLLQLYRAFIIHNGQFIMAARTGLHIRDKNLELIKTPTEFTDYKITQFLLINDTTLMMNTLGSGVLLLNTNTWHHEKFNTSNNFIANNIYTSIKKDSILWLGTEVGLIKMKLHSLLDGKPEYERWDKRNGLINNDIKFLAVTSSNVWAFADNGYSVIPKTQFDHPPLLPKPYLKSLTINDSIYQSLPTDISIDYKNTNIILKIGYLSFTNQDITSRYRLSKNDAWIYTNERIIPFNSLAPDHYIFELQYTIDNVHWIPAEINFNFNITPPWWQVWYFQAAIISIFILFILLYARYQIKNYKQKNLFLNIINSQQQKLVKAEVQITERERKRIAKELHDGVGTDLVVVKLKVMDLLSKKENEEDAVKEINDQFNATIKEIKNISYGLTPPELERFGIVVALSNYVKNISQSLETKIHFSATNPVVQKGEVEIVVFRVLQELISNTIRHAKAKNIHITLSSTEHALTIDYKDDGIGFSYAEIENGLGLANIESRVQSVNGKITFESKDAGVQYKIEIPATQG